MNRTKTPMGRGPKCGTTDEDEPLKVQQISKATTCVGGACRHSIQFVQGVALLQSQGVNFVYQEAAYTGRG